jgi:hypothetical protein
MDTILSEPEVGRLTNCLRKFLRHADIERVALTGGVAIEFGLIAAGHSGSRTSISDVDFIASHQDAVARSVANEFLVSHYHVVQPDVPKFLIQLVDPESRLRIDVFPDLVGSLAHARFFTIGPQPVKVLSLESIFAHKVLTLSGASENAGRSKHDRDARTLPF